MKRLVTIVASCIIACLFALNANAQGFITPLKTVQLNTETIVVKSDGKVIKGKLKTATCVMGYLKRVSIKDNAGVKHKLKASEIKTLKVKPSKMAKMEMLASSTENTSKISKKRYEEVINRKWLIYERTLKARKKDVDVLGQLLNPGFDKKIKVYVDPNARTSSIGGFKFGGPKSYMVVKNGKKAIMVKKKNYKKIAKELFGDCPKMMKAYKEFNYKQFAEHVFYYDQNCR
ncbi:MAG: hypothetical protein N4A72_09935 [Bacteroidales bacterium]|jgi:hypothetical protein|nr:hypothetical protein [Bacteroidales bacterium]